MNRNVWRAFKRTLPRTYERSNLPAEMRNSPILRSRRGPLGQIVVNRFTGVSKNAASRTISQFEKNLGGDKETIATMLEASPSLNGPEQALVRLLRDSTKKQCSLARLIAEAKAEPAKVIGKASQGALLLGQAEAYIEIGMSMPHVVRELRRHITPKEEMCGACQGKGMVPRSPRESKETEICPICKGEKGVLTTSDRMEFAVDKLVEMSKMGKQPASPVQVAVQQNNQGASPMAGAMERLVGMTSTLLFENPTQRSLPSPEPLEAEVVLSQSHPDESEEA